MSYRRRASPLHAARRRRAVCLALVLAAIVVGHPSCSACSSRSRRGRGAGVGRASRARRRCRCRSALLVVVNALVNRNGLTVLARLGDGGPFGQLDITLEAICYGAREGLVLIAIIRDLCTAAGRPRRGAALAAPRLFPLGADGDDRDAHGAAARADARRIGEAQRCRPVPGGRVAVMRAITANALDRSLDIAATLEVRGYGAARGARRPRTRPWSRHDLAFAVSGGAGRLRSGPPRRPRAVSLRPLAARAGRIAARRCAVRSRRRPAPSPSAVGRCGDRRCRLERVSYRYPGAAVAALRDVSLELEPGELVVLAGASASGKSTLLRVLCGLVPHFHGGRFEGRAEICGMDLREHGPAALATRGRHALSGPRDAGADGDGPRRAGVPAREPRGGAGAVARGVEEVALALGIEALLDRSTAELSGGELQRVALGAALAGRPRLLVLDEPTSQLDPVAGDELLGLLRRLNEEWGTTIVLAEHRLERCLGAADRVVALARRAGLRRLAERLSGLGARRRAGARDAGRAASARRSGWRRRRVGQAGARRAAGGRGAPRPPEPLDAGAAERPRSQPRRRGDGPAPALARPAYGTSSPGAGDPRRGDAGRRAR